MGSSKRGTGKLWGGNQPETNIFCTITLLEFGLGSGPGSKKKDDEGAYGPHEGPHAERTCSAVSISSLMSSMTSSTWSTSSRPRASFIA